MSRLLALALCAFVLAGSALARAQGPRRVEVRVVDIAGQRAYLSAGTSKGLRAGTRVSFGKLETRVEQTSHSYAVVPARRLRVGARGVADVRVAPGVGEKSEQLPPPRPLSAFADVWPAARRPADSQTPKPVPLGRMQGGTGRADATLSASGATFVPLEGDHDSVGRGELRARLSAPLAQAFPLTFLGDVSLQGWFGRYTTGVASGDSRPFWRVRELALAVGDPLRTNAQLGRLRYAAANLGPLDGGRVETARWGLLRIAGFGGLLPDPIDGQFATGAGRFGLELDLLGEDLAARPQLTVVLQGSVFDGKLDERRVFAQGQLWPGEHRVSAYGELSSFDSDNPWQRPGAEITAAGADLELRFSDLRVGGRFDMRKPERSYWLERSFPSTWLCSTASALDPVAPCTRADDTRYVVSGFGGYGGRRAMFDAGGSWAGSSDAELGHHALGHATLRFPRVGERFDLALGGSQEGGSLVSASTAVRADLGVGWLDERVRLGLYFRPAYRRYRASVEGLWEQGAGAALHVAPVPALAFDLSSDVRIGDVDALLVMLSMIARLGK